MSNAFIQINDTGAKTSLTSNTEILLRPLFLCCRNTTLHHPRSVIIIKLLLLLLLGIIVIGLIAAYYLILIALAILGFCLYLMVGMIVLVADAYGTPAGILTFLGLGLFLFLLPSLANRRG